MAGEGHDGQAHPEGVAAHGVTAEGMAVEEHVGFVMQREVFGQGHAALADQPFAGDAVAAEKLAEALAATGFTQAGGDQQQAGAGHLLKDLGPAFQEGVVELGQGVEAREGDLPAGQGRERPDRRGFVRRTEAGEGLRQTDQLLGVEMLGQCRAGSA